MLTACKPELSLKGCVALQGRAAWTWCDMCMQAMPAAIQNSTFISFLKQYGLDLRSVEYISAEYRPGARLSPIFQIQDL